jgi:CubicO group peptidase (beta-lactamase class C family)
MTVGGHVDSGWEGVRDAFDANFAAGEDVGAGVAVYHRGRKVVDLWGGHFDRDRTRPYGEDTLQLVFSTTKGVMAIAVAMCVQRGLLDYGERVSTYWPEFAAHGKGEVTVRQLLSHQVGLISVDAPTTLAEALDWDTMVARVADTKPDWPIGTAHGYHALTFGWLAGELLRRVDGRSPGRFVAEEIAGPLGLELWIGLPEHYEARVSPLIGGVISTSSDPAMQALIDQFTGPATRLGRALTLSGAFSEKGAFNRRDVHAAELPAANGISNARSLAKLYAATMAPVDGIQLLDDATRELARTTVTPRGERDLCLVLASTFGMGFMTHGEMTTYSGPGSYGHAGAGGSVAYAQPERDLAFAYVMNKMARNVAGDRRAQHLIDAAAKAADTV